jgi:DNA-binding response OmpR family regulator
MTKTILLVDDDETIRALFTVFLMRQDYEIIAAANGAEGVEKFRSEKPDLVVLDIAMPGMSGFDVTSQIREIEKSENRARTPVVLLTAYARSFFISTGSEAGIDSYLTKPITADELVRHIQKFLGESPAAASEGG